MASVSVSPTKSKPPLKKVISINGETVDAQDLSDVNIHDYSTYQREEFLAKKFIGRIRRKTFPEQDGNKTKELTKQLSFQGVAREVIRKEQVLMAFRHYSHRSDSEYETEEEVEENGKIVRKRSSKRRSAKGSLKKGVEDSQSAVSGRTTNEKSARMLSGDHVINNNEPMKQENNNTVDTVDNAQLTEATCMTEIALDLEQEENEVFQSPPLVKPALTDELSMPNGSQDKLSATGHQNSSNAQDQSSQMNRNQSIGTPDQSSIGCSCVIQ